MIVLRIKIAQPERRGIVQNVIRDARGVCLGKPAFDLTPKPANSIKTQPFTATVCVFKFC